MKTVNLILENFTHVAEKSDYNRNVYTDGRKFILEDCDEYHNMFSYYWVNFDGNDRTITEYIGYIQGDSVPSIDSSDKVELELCADYLT